MNNRKKVYNSKYPVLVGLLALMLVLGGCMSEHKRNFEWPKDIAQLTGKDLGKWLRQAPFSNELAQNEGDKTVFTNAKQVFPFMARYNNAVEELQNSYSGSDDPIYQQETVLYQDPEWGDLFVNATLLYDAQEVFLEEYYRKSGNLMFGGANAAMDSYSATLGETEVFDHTPDYKTGIYWASTRGNRYLLGFYQKGKLVFETAIPFQNSDTLATLSKLNEVNETLGLDIAEWKNATVQKLKARGTRKTFWDDPFVGIYWKGKAMIPQAYLKIKDTPFQRARNAVKGDHYFHYDTPKGKVELFTLMKETDKDEPAFEKAHRQLQMYEKNGQKVFYEDQQKRERIKGVAKTYVGSGKYMEVHFEYPQADPDVQATIHGILQHVRAYKYL